MRWLIVLLLVVGILSESYEGPGNLQDKVLALETRVSQLEAWANLSKIQADTLTKDLEGTKNTVWYHNLYIWSDLIGEFLGIFKDESK